MTPLGSLLRMRLWRLRNFLLNLEKNSVAKSCVVTAGLINVMALGLWVSYESFAFIAKFPAIGLGPKMISLLFLALLVLVVLSTMIITYTTLFLARETAFFFQHPISPRTILLTKLGEAITFSSWASLLLCLPVLVSFGLVRGAPLLYYFEAAMVLGVFLLFAGLLGALVTLLLAPLVKRLTPRALLGLGAALLAALGWVFLRSFRFFDLDGENNLWVLDRFASGLSALSSPFSPSHWASSAVLAASAGNHGEMLLESSFLLANTLIFLPLLSLYGGRFYGRAWASRQSAAVPRRAARGRHRPARLVATGPLGALTAKDVLSFIRDPAQLSQSILFILLMVIYSLSLFQIPRHFTGEKLGQFIYLANLGAVCMILSSFTSRFLFPLISLEGRAFWILGLAPMPRSWLLRQKVLLGLGISLCLGLLMAVISNLSLKTPPEHLLGAIFTVSLVAICLSSLATGLGAAYPNFDEDNPARIAVGLGGTLNFFASALAVAILIAIEALPYLLKGSAGRPPAWSVALAHALALTFTAAVSAAALRLGERALARSEF
jgi:ABC-2 type transport system permease protein